MNTPGEDARPRRRNGHPRGVERVREQPRSRFRTGLRIGVSLLLLALLTLRVGPGRVAAALEGVDPRFVALAVSLILADGVLRAFNWWLLLTRSGARSRFGTVLYSLGVGGFFGFLFPSSLGPDVARAVMLAGRSGLGTQKTLSSVLVLNLVGLWALTTVALFGVGYLALEGRRNPFLAGVAVVSALYIGLVFLMLARPWKLPALPERVASWPGMSRLVRFLRRVASYRENRRVLGAVFLVALANQLLAISVVWAVFRGGGVSVSWAYFAAVVPVINVARTIPLNVAGFGAEQGVFVLLFSGVGVAPPATFAFSLLVSLLNLLVTAGWGCVHVLREVHGLARRTPGPSSVGRPSGPSSVGRPSGPSSVGRPSGPPSVGRPPEPPAG